MPVRFYPPGLRLKSPGPGIASKSEPLWFLESAEKDRGRRGRAVVGSEWGNRVSIHHEHKSTGSNFPSG